MPRGPKGKKRPADVIGNAVHVMRIATGEIEDDRVDPAADQVVDPAVAFARLGGLKGGPARAAKLSASKRADIARKAAQKRWSRGRAQPGRKGKGTRE